MSRSKSDAVDGLIAVLGYGIAGTRPVGRNRDRTPHSPTNPYRIG